MELTCPVTLSVVVFFDLLQSKGKLNREALQREGIPGITNIFEHLETNFAQSNDILDFLKEVDRKG